MCALHFTPTLKALYTCRDVRIVTLFCFLYFILFCFTITFFCVICFFSFLPGTLFDTWGVFCVHQKRSRRSSELHMYYTRVVPLVYSHWNMRHEAVPGKCQGALQAHEGFRVTCGEYRALKCSAEEIERFDIHTTQRRGYQRPCAELMTKDKRKANGYKVIYHITMINPRRLPM
jgi:hypothetical protein